MTGVEKIRRIEEITKAAGPMGLKYREADEIKELRADIKVSDWFMYLNDDDSGLEAFYKVFGFDVFPGGRRNPKLDAAITDGYVKMYDYRQYGRYFYRIKLTAKGKKLISKKLGA